MINKAAEEQIELIMVLTRFPRYVGQGSKDTKTCFHEHLNKEWEELLPMYFISYFKGVRTEQAIQLKIALYMTAAGLVAFGRKDVIPFLFLDVSSIGRIIRLRRVLSHILPLPEELNDLSNKEDVLHWLEVNYDKLIWNEDEKIFVMK